MTPRETLNTLYKQHQRMRQCCQMLSAMQQDPHYTKEAKQRATRSLAAYRRRYDRNCQRALALVQKVEDPLQKKILMLRYVHGCPWDQIERQLGYSHRHIMRLNRTAVAQLRKYGEIELETYE